MEKVKVTAIVTAGGKGIRLQGEVKKQFRIIAGKPLIIHTLQHFFQHPMILDIIVTLPEEDIERFTNLAMEYFPGARQLSRLNICQGGVHRQDSIYNALQICAKDTGIVLIHDAVRPFITEQLITTLIKKAMEFGAVIPTAAIKNTIKVINGDTIDHTLRRDKLIQVYTPQVFDFELIMKCYTKAMTSGYYSTDDAALLEHYGFGVHVLSTTAPNIKITDEFDFFIAEQLFKDDNIQRFIKPE
jgi:2-C-methyl-D-erythritol 4-phosphate cytidylyltransferase